ncbi:lysylphosphatidylglycerol synthase transmembrane domain-containing protein [Methanosphaerula subterraneus]|uniref:lysylphosphatidylglycerol synthase transmembrane domain-containing protein n=1 Tax=Methanosphaerula subterraneus TaxID=3350244 RepID=UPI003F86938A
MYRKLSAIVIPTLLAAGILGFMLYSVRADLSVAIANSVPAYILVAVLVCVAAWWLRGFRYRSILHGLSIRPTLTFATASIFISQTANLVIPARLGDIVRVFILKHEYSTTYSQGLSSLLVERIFDVVTVALLGLISVLFVLNVPEWFYEVIVIPLVAGVVFFVLLIVAGRFQTKNRYVGMVLTMLDEVRRVSLNLRSLLVLGLSSIVIWILDATVCMAVVLMFEQPLDPVIVILAIVIGNLIKTVPVTPGGMGIYEAAVAGVFVTLGGMPLATATLIAVIDHLIKNLITGIGGAISIYLCGDWVMPVIWRIFQKKVVEGESIGGD